MAVALIGPPVVALNSDGRLDLFAIANDYSLYHIWQTSPGGSWSSWFSHSRPSSSMLGYPPAIAASSDGRLELFVVGESYDLYHIWQTSPGGSWSNWDSLGQP